jgi:hypothetical protein
MVVSLIATKRVVNESFADGWMGWLLYVFAIPVLSLAIIVRTSKSGTLWTADNFETAGNSLR